MRRKTNLKKRILLVVIMLVTMVVSVNAAWEGYAVFNERSGVLSFKYGEKPTSGDVYSVTSRDAYPEWYAIRSKVKEVVIDSLFSNCYLVNCSHWFEDMAMLSKVEGLKYLNTSNVTSMESMFSRCTNLTTLDARGLNTSQVTCMSDMFSFCIKLTTLDVSGFNTSNVSAMEYMFSGCSALTALDVSGFNTSKLTNMKFMFKGCSSLTTLDVSSFNTSSVTDMNSMFYGCSGLTTLDVSGFNTARVNNAGFMFNGCSSLTTIYCNDTWSCSGTSMFNDCEKLKGAIEYDGSKTNATYANPETGYFTYIFEEYPLSINGTTVTDLNEKDLTSISGVSGTASYDNATKTLTLTDALIYNINDAPAIQTELDSLNIVVNGECVVGSSKMAGIAGTSHITVKGKGSLQVMGKTGITLDNNSLTVCDSVKLDVMGTLGNGISDTKEITVSGDSTVLKLMGSTGAFGNIGALTMNGHLGITDPAGARFTDGVITDIGGNAVQWATISCYDIYGVKLADTLVTSANYCDLAIIDGVTGAVTYDEATHTLSLTDATITGTDYGIYVDSAMDTLFVNVTGECSIDCPGGTGIYSLAGCVKIQGDGTLNISGEKGIYMALSSANTLWVADGVKVKVDGTTYGVQGGEYTRDKFGGGTTTDYITTLKVDGRKTMLSVKGTTQCYQTLGNFTLSDGYAVTAPTKAVFYQRTPNGKEQYTFCQYTVVMGKLLTLTYVPIANTWVTIEDTRLDYIKGDANGDGSVTMADANLVVNYFLATDKSTVDINVEAANVNGDDDITMADANMIVNMFLGNAQ